MKRPPSVMEERAACQWVAERLTRTVSEPDPWPMSARTYIVMFHVAEQALEWMRAERLVDHGYVRTELLWAYARKLARLSGFDVLEPLPPWASAGAPWVY